MLKYGIISEIDAPKGLARVKFEEDDIVSDWLRISVPNTQDTKDEVQYAVNEPVWCIMDKDSENGVIGGSYYSSSSTPPVGNADTRSVTFKDGTKITYNSADSVLIVECVGDVSIKCVNATVEASGEVTIDTPEATFTGNVTIEQGLSVGDGAEISGSIQASGQVTALSGTPASVSLSTHNHPTAPVGPVSPPTPGT